MKLSKEKKREIVNTYDMYNIASKGITMILMGISIFSFPNLIGFSIALSLGCLVMHFIDRYRDEAIKNKYNAKVVPKYGSEWFDYKLSKPLSVKSQKLLDEASKQLNELQKNKKTEPSQRVLSFHQDFMQLNGVNVEDVSNESKNLNRRRY